MALQIDDVSIRCMGCSQSQTLEQAVRNGWKMCRSCNFAICTFCYDNLGEPRHCLSPFCAAKSRLIDTIPLPVEKILIFAREYSYKDYRKGLLYKLFYEEAERCHAGPMFTIEETQEGNISEDDKPTKVQEEAWRNFHLVVTKRRGGKFITWEKVY